MLLDITVTGIVSTFVLAPGQDHIGVGSVLLHYVAPPLALLAWRVLAPVLLAVFVVADRRRSRVASGR